MAESVVANPNMHYGAPNVGILTPPDKLPKPHIYSDAEGQKIYNTMQHDLYIESKNAKTPQLKTPIFLKILIGLGIIGSAGFIVRKPILKFLKKILHKA